jgi:uncharacterized membrane protein
MATDQNSDTTQTPPLTQLRHELGRYVGARARRTARRAGHRLSEAADRLLDVDEDSGTVPKVGSRVLHGESPAAAIAAETGANLTSGVVGKVRNAVSGGDGDSDDGDESADGKATNIIEMIDVGVPLRTAYDHWTEYDTFSGFAKAAQHARRGDEAVSEWTVKVGPSTRTWKSTVQEQLPDDRIVWTSEGSTGTTQGAVSFHEITPTLTRILMVLVYQPSGIVEKAENLWGAQGRRARLDFENFQRYVTFSEEEVEGWRGEVREGEVVETHEEAMAREEDEAEDEEYDDEEYEDDEEGAG